MPDDTEPSTSRSAGAICVAQAVEDSELPRRKRIWPPERVLVATLLRREGREPAGAPRSAEAGRHARYQHAPLEDTTPLPAVGARARSIPTHVAVLCTVAMAMTVTGLLTSGDAKSDGKPAERSESADQIVGTVAAGETSRASGEVDSAEALPRGTEEPSGAAPPPVTDETIDEWREFAHAPAPSANRRTDDPADERPEGRPSAPPGREGPGGRN